MATTTCATTPGAATGLAAAATTTTPTTTTSTTNTTSPTEPFPAFNPDTTTTTINNNNNNTDNSAPRTPTLYPPVSAIHSINNSNHNNTSIAKSTILPTISEHSVFLQRPQAQLPPFSPTFDLSPKSTKFPAPFSPRRSPAPLTGAAAMADAKRKRQQQQDQPLSRDTTPNPAVAAMQSLMGGGGGAAGIGAISRPSDAPTPNKLSEPLRKAAEKINIPDRSTTTSAQTSPVSLSSFGTVDYTNGNNGRAMTATAAGSAGFVAEPDAMESTDHATSTTATSNEHTATADEDEAEDGNKAFTYPGLPSQHHINNDHHHDSAPARGMSLPGVGYSDSAKSSPANKRHKCPYCATDFTRHHNLKSHLLTHSQEKPYVCSTCQARFRRLHDLKRHTKLHTGERPHTCEKCGRRFARGDALARHNKGPGGCALRRSSFGGDDDLGDGTGDGMDGVEYTNDEDDDEDVSDPQARRVSEPSRKRAHIETPHDPNRSVYRQHSSTYPPIQHKPGEMGPPAVMHPGNNLSTSPRDMTGSHGAPASYFQAYAQHSSGMTESPKPLSPGHPPDQHRLSVDMSNAGSLGGRNRSPSLTTQFQQTHFGRGSGGRTPPQPPPAQFPAGHMQPGTQLPPLTLSTAAAGRSGISGSGPGPSLLHHQQVPPNSVSNPGSASSHGQSSGSSMRDILGTSAGALSAGGEADLWSHLRQLEGKFVRMQDEYELRISRLQEEVISLRSQLNNVQNNGQSGSYPGEPRY